MSVVVSLLWPKSYPIIGHLARRGFQSFAMMGSWVNEQLLADLATIGAQLINLEGLTPARIGELTQEGAQRVAAVKPYLRELIERPSIMRHGGIAGEPSAAIERSLQPRVIESMKLIESLHLLNSMLGIQAVLLNDVETMLSKAAAMWAKTHNVRTFLVSHGAVTNPHYTTDIPTSGPYEDYALLYGERSRPSFLAKGLRPEQLWVTGSPGWDDLANVAAERAAIRKRIYEQSGLRSEIPLVVFATTWVAGLSVMNGPQTYDQSLGAFFRALRLLRERGVQFNTVVKGRPVYGDAEARQVSEVAQAAGFTDYQFETGNLIEFIAAADVLAGFDSNAFVEALIIGTPCVNIWVPQSWLLGPAFDAADGIPRVSHNAPAELASVIEALLTSERYRRTVLDRGAQIRGDFNYGIDGKGAERAADRIAAALA